MRTSLLPLLKPLGLRILMEPGRFISGNAGILVTRVEYVKRTGRKNFLIVDAAMNDLIRPAFYEAYHEIVPARPQRRRESPSDVVGPICESGDFFCKDRPLPKVSEGDLPCADERRRVWIRHGVQLQHAAHRRRSAGERQKIRPGARAAIPGETLGWRICCSLAEVSGSLVRWLAFPEQTSSAVSPRMGLIWPYFIMAGTLKLSLRSILLGLLIAGTGAARAANTGDSADHSSTESRPVKSLKTALEPAVKNGGFQMDDYMIWCSSVIKVGETYDMFASRWPAKYGMAGWTRYSECVRATSTNLFGPYQFQEVVLQKRPGHWDKSRVHNVKIVKAGSRFVLFYINTANETGYATADSITGPWIRCEQPVIRASNPAPLVRPDSSLYVFCRLRDHDGVNRGIAFTAPSFEGPYIVIENGDNLLPNGGELEDPTIWWVNGQYNILLNDWQGHATGIAKAGAQYYSPDGVRYHLVSPEPVFTKAVVFDDGSTETFRRRERPFVYVDKNGTALALFTACLPENGPSRVVVQPINHYRP